MGTASGKQLRRRWLDGGADRLRLFAIAVVMPLLLLAIAVIGVTFYCDGLLVDAATGADAGSAHPLFVAGSGFLCIAVAVTVLQAARVAHRVAGPEYRLQQALQRIRAGDLTFRVHLRKGDLLGGLANECNELLEWLNANPPAGARTGSDLLDLHGHELPEAVGVAEEP